MKKFTLALATLALSVASMQAQTYCLAGGFNNWSADANPFTETSAGIYELQYDGFIGGEIVITDGTWNTKWGAGDATIKLDTPCTLASGGGNIAIDNQSSDYAGIINPTFTLDTTGASYILTVKGTLGNDEFTYGIHGSIFTGTWETHEMKKEGDKWVLNENLQKGNFGIKELTSKGAQNAWIAADGSTTVTPNAPLKAKVNGTNWTSNLTGNYSFTFDPEAMTLIIASASLWNDITADENATFAIYTIEGNIVKASANAADVENLESGMYIINGEKVMICK